MAVILKRRGVRIIRSGPVNFFEFLVSPPTTLETKYLETDSVQLALVRLCCLIRTC